MTNDEPTASLDIRQHLRRGLHAFDVAGERAGTVDDWDLFREYIIIRPHLLSEKRLYIPFSAVTHIDRREVYVSKSRDDMNLEYSSPPPRNTTIDIPPPERS